VFLPLTPHSIAALGKFRIAAAVLDYASAGIRERMIEHEQAVAPCAARQVNTASPNQSRRCRLSTARCDHAAVEISRERSMYSRLWCRKYVLYNSA
jgi:hypothetical protein